MKTKYRVFHKVEVWPGVWGIRPYDLRDRTKAQAIELAKTLKLGNVRPKGGSRIVWAEAMEVAAA